VTGLWSRHRGAISGGESAGPDQSGLIDGCRKPRVNAMNGALIALVLAHGLFVLSGVVYAVYWVLQEAAPGPTAALLFVLSILFGFAAATLMLARILASLPLRDGQKPSLRQIVVANLALLLAMEFGTTWLMGRPLTSELPFVIIWSTVELGAVRVSFSRGWLTRASARTAAAAVSTALALALTCYATYFLFKGTARFYCGLVPYGVVALVMAWIGALLWSGRRRVSGGINDEH
jgi:hypothetical protein